MRGNSKALHTLHETHLHLRHPALLLRALLLLCPCSSLPGAQCSHPQLHAGMGLGKLQLCSLLGQARGDLHTGGQHKSAAASLGQRVLTMTCNPHRVQHFALHDGEAAVI